jgi:hypothetical protein
LEGAEEHRLPILAVERFAAGGDDLQVPVTGSGGKAGEITRGEFAAEIEPGGGAAGLCKFGAGVYVFERGVGDEVLAGVLCVDALAKEDQVQEDR